jgi:very-short-patch-repair endonuclease/ribosomal protein S27AE
MQTGMTYCSKTCELAAAPKVDKVCPECGKTFTVLASQAERYNFCSYACRTARTKYQTCERCGKPFVAERHLNRHYCSEECRRPPNFVECQTCGTTFRDVPSATNRRFCSLACYRRFRGETSLEAQVRTALTGMQIDFIQEASIGRYSVDFLLPTRRIALEVDGAYWHQDPNRDARKNRYLARHGWQVARIPESDVVNGADLAQLIAALIHMG